MPELRWRTAPPAVALTLAMLAPFGSDAQANLAPHLSEPHAAAAWSVQVMHLAGTVHP
jgi:hypothetical protein